MTPKTCNENKTAYKSEILHVIGKTPAGWRIILEKIIPYFPEVQEIRFAKIANWPEATFGQNNNDTVCFVLAIYLRSYTPGFKLRELKLTLNRFFKNSLDHPLHLFYAANAYPKKNQIAAKIYPQSDLLQKIKIHGNILYNRDQFEQKNAAPKKNVA